MVSALDARLDRHSATVLGIFRIVIGLLFGLHGSAKLFGCTVSRKRPRILKPTTAALSSETPQQVSTLVPKSSFLTLKKSQPSLIENAFPYAFQAYDEGSIPFTRSNAFKYLHNWHRPRMRMGRRWDDQHEPPRFESNAWAAISRTRLRILSCVHFPWSNQAGAFLP